MNDLEGALHERIIHAWRILDNLAPQEARASSYEDIPPTYLGVPLGSVPGLWGQRKGNKKPLLPSYLRQDILQKLLPTVR
eukprot:scaffold7829_cov13-Tisochrysis_lutea.AAC.1